jgi:segregation and condensation protein A
MYTIRLQNFEGPLDLLLFFIKRDELDIYNIPIARITKEFLDYLHFMESLDLEVAGEFVVMAAELMQIKAKLLLPPEPGEVEETDPRANLVKRLVEYKRFKEVATGMVRMEAEAARRSARGYFDADPVAVVEEDNRDVLREVSLFDLIASFRFAVERMPKRFVHEITRLNVTIDEQIQFLTDFFSRRSEATFGELVVEMDERIRVVVTFLALLEMIRSSRLIVRQRDSYGEISIMRPLT